MLLLGFYVSLMHGALNYHKWTGTGPRRTLERALSVDTANCEMDGRVGSMAGKFKDLVAGRYFAPYLPGRWKVCSRIEWLSYQVYGKQGKGKKQLMLKVKEDPTSSR